VPPRFSRTIGRPGVAPGCFHRPFDLAYSHGYVIVAEQRRLQLLTRHGVPQQVIAPPGMGSLSGLCVSGSRLLVADPEMRRLHQLEHFRDRFRDEADERLAMRRCE